MNNKILLIISFFILVLASCSSGDSSNLHLNEDFSNAYDLALSDKIDMFKPMSAVAENPENPATEEKVKLGHALYFDTRLSKEGNISCNSCHNLATFGVDNLPVSPGDDGTLGNRNSPTVLNAAFHAAQFWDGRAKDVEEQAGMPILNPVEMAIPSKEFLVDRLKNIELYQELFAEAYPDEANPITYKNIEYAIGAFERQLLTPTRFDEYLKGKHDALSTQEKQGLLSFVLVGCTTCHSDALLGATASFQRFGVYDDYWKHTKSAKIDKGLAEVTGKELDEYMFKVPSLRNVAETWPYFHDGSVESLEQSIRIMAEIQLDQKLNDRQIENIAAFLKSLTGEVPKEFQKAPEVLSMN